MIHTLFDKSFFQMFSLDESVWFDHFYKPVVCPIFCVETLADLAHQGLKNRTPDRAVQIIADKFPDHNGVPCTDHRSLVVGNLLGEPLPLNGRIPISGGRTVRSDGKTGVVFEEAPETKAFGRWQNAEFSEIERSYESNRKSNWADIAYLFYLPFCHVFTSQDDVHRQCAPLFLRPDQKFLLGEEVKADLRRLNAQYLELPEIEKKKGILAFAHWPPKDGDFLTAQLFDHFEPSWRDDKPITKLPPEVEKGIVDRMNAMIKSKDMLPADTRLDDENLRELSIQHRVRRKKGSWYQVAADLVIPPEARGK